jgi:hypothetical protein
MAAIDERLIDPEQQALARLLDRATRVANARLPARRVRKDLFDWHQFVRRQRNRPEGCQVFNGGRGTLPAALVRVAWWTDAIGRRHWRVAGRRLQWCDAPARDDPFAAFPLWHVHPDRLVLRRAGGPDELLAVCACGEAGPPTAIGWTGERCGPCHDRLEEGFAPPPGPEVPLTLTRHTAPVGHLAFTADGRLLSGGSDGRVILWDLEDGASEVLLHRRGGNVYQLAVSSRGVVAATTSGNRVLLLDLQAGRSWRAVQLRRSWIFCLEFSPDGGLLGVLGGGAWLLDPAAEGGAPRPIPADRSPLGNLLFVGNGPEALVNSCGSDGLARVDLRTGERVTLREGARPELEDDPYALMGYGFTTAAWTALSPDGQWLAAEGIWDGWAGVHLHHFPTRRWWPLAQPSPAGGVQTMRFTARGDLAVAEGDGGLRLWDPGRRQLLGTLLTGSQWRWVVPYGTPYGFRGIGPRAFSPDGSLVAEGDQAGTVRVWPWRRLLLGG